MGVINQMFYIYSGSINILTSNVTVFMYIPLFVGPPECFKGNTSLTFLRGRSIEAPYITL